MWANAPTETSEHDPSYSMVSIQSPPPDLDCGDTPHRNYMVLPPDAYRFDGDGDGVGYERWVYLINEKEAVRCRSCLQ